MKSSLVAAACVLALLSAGCKRDAATPAPAPAPPPPPQAPARASPPTDDGGPRAATPDAGDEDAKPASPGLRIATVDGKTFDLAAHRGKWVIVNFWATWCAPCRKEMPELSALDAMHEDIDAIGLAYEDIEPADMAAFLKAHPVVYPIAVIDTMDPPADFATPRGLPMTYLIAPDGKVAKQFLGPVTAREIEGAIAANGGKAT